MAKGFTLHGNEPLKITVKAKDFGYTGEEMADILRQNSVECEFCDPDFLVLMPSVDNTETDYERVKNAFGSMIRKEAILTAPPAVPNEIKTVMSIREALLSSKKTLPIKDVRGQICASVSESCPPAIPIVICGQIIGDEQIELFEYYGVDFCQVLDLG